MAAKYRIRELSVLRKSLGRFGVLTPQVQAHLAVLEQMRADDEVSGDVLFRLNLLVAAVVEARDGVVLDEARRALGGLAGALPGRWNREAGAFNGPPPPGPQEEPRG